MSPVKKVGSNVGSMHQALARLAMGVLGIQDDIFCQMMEHRVAY